MMPPGYKIYKCCNEARDACGCYTALKRAPSGGCMPQCKIHGARPDGGAEEALNSIIKAGYCGIVVTQFPIHSVKGKNLSRSLPSMNRSRKSATKSQGGRFQPRPIYLDMLLCGSSTFAAIEVQGTSHSDKRTKHRDTKKAGAVSRFENCMLFEMQACEREYRPRGGRGKSVPNAISHSEVLAHEVVNYLYR